MFSNEALSIVIGLTFIYLLYSLLGTLLQEILATHLQLRSFTLRKAIRTLLDDKSSKNEYSTAFLNHPAVKYLRKSNWITKCPAYISPEVFAKVMVDLLRGNDVVAGSSVKEPIESSLKNEVLAWGNTVAIKGDTLEYLKSIWIDSQGDVEKFRVLLEGWYVVMMDKTTGWYKKYTQFMLLFIGLGVAITFNVDTIKIVKKLESNPTLTAQIVNQAGDFLKAHPNLEAELEQSRKAITQQQIPFARKDSLLAEADVFYNANKKLRDSLVNQAQTLIKNDVTKVNDLLAIGWPNGFFKLEIGTWPRAILGWLLTALAISLGAPFWFDLLNKVMQLRASVATDNKKAGNASTAGEPIKRVG